MSFKFETIELSSQEEFEITRFSKSFGAEWVQRMIAQKKARKYLETYCELIKEESTYSEPYRCYAEGTDIYRRKDGLPIADDDVAALKVLDNGQVNVVKCDVNGMKMSHYWVCDSSD